MPGKVPCFRDRMVNKTKEFCFALVSDNKIIIIIITIATIIDC